MWWVETLLLPDHCLSQSHNAEVSNCAETSFFPLKNSWVKSRLYSGFAQGVFFFACPFIKYSKGTESETKPLAIFSKHKLPPRARLAAVS